MTACRSVDARLMVLLLLLLGTSQSVAQVVLAQPNSSAATLTMNGEDGPPYPVQAEILGPALLTVEISGNAPLAPIILCASADIVFPGTPITPNITVNIDLANHFEIFNGVYPGLAPLSQFAFLNSAGFFTWGFPVPHPGIAPLVVGGFQAVVMDPAEPNGLAVSAATRLVLIPTPNLGNFDFSGGPATDRHAARIVSLPGQVVPILQGIDPVDDDFDVNTIRLAGFQEFSATATSPFINKDPSTLPVTAFNAFENTEFPFVRTIHGDLYLIEENAPDPPLPGGTPGSPIHCWSFALSNPGTGPQLITSSSIAGEGTLGDTNPFKEKIQVQNNRLAYVQDPVAPGVGDRLFLTALDGILPGAPGGIGTTDVTPIAPQPVPLGISDESLSILTGHVYFVGSTSNAQPSEGLLYSAPVDGSATAAAVSIPPLGTGNVAANVDAIMRYSEDRTRLLFQAGASANEEDLFMIVEQSSAPLGILGVTTLTCNLTNFTTGTQICGFGTASSGSSNTVAISPDPVAPATGNPWVAFVVDVNGSQELVIQELTCPAPVPITLTTNANFDPAIDSILELHWTSDDVLLFFAGDTPATTDLFAYQRSTSIFRNLTAPISGGTPPSPPFSPGGTIDPGANFFNSTGTWFFLFREGETGGETVSNLVAMNVATSLASLSLVNATGSEFEGGTLPNAHGATPTTSSMQFAATSDVVAFTAVSGSGNEQNVFGFDCANPLAPQMLTSNNGNSGGQIDNLLISPNGNLVAFTDNHTGYDVLYVASLALGNSATIVYEPDPPLLNGVLTKGTIKWNSNEELVISYGSDDPENPTNADIIYVQVAVRFNVQMTEVPKTNWHY